MVLIIALASLAWPEVAPCLGASASQANFLHSWKGIPITEAQFLWVFGSAMTEPLRLSVFAVAWAELCPQIHTGSPYSPGLQTVTVCGGH